MNFIVIVSDSLRRDHVSCYDDQPSRWASGADWKIETPNMDRLAALGARFDNYYVASFPTVLNRHELITSLPVFTYHEWAPLPANEATLGAYLAQAGYRSMLVADTPHLFRLGFNYARDYSAFDWIRGQENDAQMTDPRDAELTLPFDEAKIRPTLDSWRNHTRTLRAARHEDEYFAPMTFKRASQWLERNRSNRPFCLVVDTFDPHEPWDPPDWYVEKFYPSMAERVTFPANDHASRVLNAEDLISAHAHYCGEVAMVDRWLGHLLDTVSALNILDDTAILFVSDHGYMFGEKDICGKHVVQDGVSKPIPLWPEVSHIPFLAYIPGLTTPGSAISGFTQPQDILPTLMDLAGLDRPAEFCGHSLVPLISGQVEQVRPVAISSHSIIGSVAGRPARVTDPEWSLYTGAAVTQQTPRSLSGYFGATAVLRDPWYVAAAVAVERTEYCTDGTLAPKLFNDRVDPRHENNVIAEHPAVAERLRDLFIDYLVECGTRQEHIAPRRAMTYR